MKNLYRALSLSTALLIVSLASAHGLTFGTCEYRCHNTTTGQTTIVQTGTSQADCCNGNVTCPAGSTYSGTLFWSGGHGPVRCAA